ncbi:SDR family NAD(P)-dependent oxidoreductase [Cedecea sp. NFIX57]|uniref:SDR family NAD(P)-dependent oxidoreductase n=1 Tax=Cedecea sp. NFIX57 TaxID=1566286 RepID=UPI000A0C33F4|nr:glucose 1-dehydrogenase [Cedecea sp. NFIX57]SMG32699.1 3-oxoacyl-[acyl-carrier protein] reductase [Cedecea sp. NFIX57]
MLFTLKDKVALVTGASSGIGADIAQALAKAGAFVVVNYRSNQAGAQAVVDAIKENGGRALAVAADVTDAIQAKALVEAAINIYDRLDVIVNNAGLALFSSVEDFDSREYELQFRTNVLGPMLVTSAALKHLQPGASIINISSSATEFSPVGASVYAATKGALDAYTRVLANELGPKGIRVNTLKPGLTVTEKSFPEGTAESDLTKQYVARTPLRRLGNTNDVASAAVFLASEAAAFITGDHLLVSGGLR